MYNHSGLQVTYVGPKEDVDINEESLSKADVYAQPGGGGKFNLVANPPSFMPPFPCALVLYDVFLDGSYV